MSRFVVLNGQVDFAGETKLGASEEEEAAWKQQRHQSHAAAPEYPFICQVHRALPGLPPVVFGCARAPPCVVTHQLCPGYSYDPLMQDL